jgi:hypothetical protein
MKRETMHTGRISFEMVTPILGAVWALLLLSCSNPADSTGPELDSGGPGIIVPGESIDGVRLGDSRERVEKLLGEPSGIGWADGMRGWRTYRYKPPETEGGGLGILFIEEEDLSWGPVDAFNVDKPYDGKTPQGIGIGSTLEEIIEAYGEPDDIPEDVIVDGTHRLQHTYCFDSVKFTIGMHNQVVRGFFIGFFIPIEQDQTYQCK